MRYRPDQAAARRPGASGIKTPVKPAKVKPAKNKKNKSGSERTLGFGAEISFRRGPLCGCGSETSAPEGQAGAGAGTCFLLTPYYEGDFTPAAEAAASALSAGGFLICVDGGAELARRWNLRPSLLLGDFDSLNKKGCADIFPSVPVHSLPEAKDDTDTLAALRHALSLGFSDIMILGGMGGRLDHTVANLQTLYFAALRGASVRMADGKNAARILLPGSYEIAPGFLRPFIPPENAELSDSRAFPVSGSETAFKEKTVSGASGEAFSETISFFAFNGSCLGLSLSGFRYPLSDARLDGFFPIGVSNRFKPDETPRVSFRAGALLMIVSAEKPSVSRPAFT